jgi:tetratricopeptide (TPR) repeat protein
MNSPSELKRYAVKAYLSRTGAAAALVSLALGVAAAGSQAAGISISPGETTRVFVDGPLLPDDGKQFRARTAALSKATVVLQSDGGSVLAGIEIGEAIRLKGFSSLVIARCASACALAWLGGTPRLAVGYQAKIGFHAAYNAQTGQEWGAANALVGAYLTKIGLPDEAVIYITKAAPTSMSWLTFSEAKQSGIDVTWIDKSTTLAEVRPSGVSPQSWQEGSPGSSAGQPVVRQTWPATGSTPQQLENPEQATCQKAAGDEAIAACTRRIDSGIAGRPRAIAYHNRGVALGRKGDYDRALADLNEAIRLDPNSAVAYNSRGIAYRLRANHGHSRADYDRAIADHTEAIRLNPNFPAAYRNRGAVYNSIGHYDRAISESDEAIRLDPKNPLGYNIRGNSLRLKGDYDRALADLNEAIRLGPKNAEAYSIRGGLYSLRGQHDLALADLNEAIRLNPRAATAWNNRGFAYNNMRNYDRALKDLDEAIRLDPNHASAHKNRAVSYEKNGDLQNALVEYNLSLALDPTNPRIQEAVEGVKRVQQALTARRASGESQAARPDVVQTERTVYPNGSAFCDNGTAVQC